MATTEFYHWWIVDQVTGERVLTPYKLTSAHAALAFPGAEPDLRTREARDLPDTRQDPWGNSKSGEPWEDSKPADPWADTEPWSTMSEKTPGLGESVILPSGVVVKVTTQALRESPWIAFRSGSVWYVCGNKRQDDRGAMTYFIGWPGRTPLQLAETDARALAKILNRVR